MIKCVSILGSTGSIGRQTVEVCLALGIPVAALAARGSVDLLEEQAVRLRPKLVAVYDERAAAALRVRLAGSVLPEADCVVTAVSGSIGLEPTLAAIDAGKRIALANKETLVCAGTIVMERAKQHGVDIIPVDSEHSAIFQCLSGRQGELRKILLTGSGGPFLTLSLEEMAFVTPRQAVRHPNWSMGAKISVDSATMMNKGLEFIEAMHLFSCRPEEIEVVVHPESVIHSMVELTDGTVIAQLGVPDMRLPIQYALTWPERLPSMSRRLDFTELGSLRFLKPDLDRMRCLALAIACAERGGTAPAVLSAANEEAVALFLGGKIGFNGIYDCVAAALDSIEIVSAPDLEELRSADAAARSFIKEKFC